MDDTTNDPKPLKFQLNRAVPDRVVKFRATFQTQVKQRQRMKNARNAPRRRCWRLANPDKIREYAKKNSQKRRTHKHDLPFAFTADDERRALAYFNGRCAACGRPLTDLFGEHTAAMDHWISLSDTREDNPGTVPTNMIPLCHGVGGCNNRKYTADPAEWLEREFGKRKARVILARVAAYFEWTKTSEK